MTTNFDPKSSLTKIQGRDYLGAHEAITWFRQDFPIPRSQIITFVDVEARIIRAEIYVDTILVSTADVANPVDNDGNLTSDAKTLEKLQTSAVRRALAFAGYGTISALAHEVEGGKPYQDSASAARVALSLEGETVEDAKAQLSPGGNTGKKTRVGSNNPITPVADTIISHKKKKPDKGNAYHAFITAGGRKPTVYTRTMFIDAGWIDENDWQVVDEIHNDLDIPIELTPDGEYWKVTMVAPCNPDDIPF